MPVTQERTRSRLSDNCFSLKHRTLDERFKMCDNDVVEFVKDDDGVCTPIAYMDVKFIMDGIRYDQFTSYMIKQVKAKWEDKYGRIIAANSLSCYQTTANAFDSPFLVYFYRPADDLYIALSLNAKGDEVLQELINAEVGKLRDDAPEIYVNGVAEARYSVTGKYDDLNSFIGILRQGR